MTPMLDLMQTMPTFAYLIPMLLLFGNSPVSAMLATAIFAMPPMVRATMLALSRVPHEIHDFGDMVGCTRRQKLWRVLIPSARPTLMIGVNQVIMLALNMVIISSMIGAGGLGYDVLLALRALKIGAGHGGGSRNRRTRHRARPAEPGRAARRARPAHVEAARCGSAIRHADRRLAVLAVTTLARACSSRRFAVPRRSQCRPRRMWKAAVDWITINFFDAIEAFRVALLIYFLNPMRDFCEDIPVARRGAAAGGSPAIGWAACGWPCWSRS